MDERIKQLNEQLINVLTELDKIKPVQFLDVECDESVYNYGGLEVSEEDNRIYIRMLMYHDNLPAHKENPILDNRGMTILPEK